MPTARPRRSGPASSRYLPADLTTVTNQLPTATLSAEHRRAALAGCERLAKETVGLEKGQVQAFAVCHAALKSAQPTVALPATELAYWRQFFESTTAYSEVLVAVRERPIRMGEGKHITLRDDQMAKNLIWLAQNPYAKRKIIVWGHAFHLLRNPENVALVVDPGKSPAQRKTARRGWT